ncbi:MAG TPA: glycine--tRNA ligase subunit alpha [Terriglobia bacterium]|nr:glycine--tRNA ligase subunit alpha [Terriglobia bacterium]
MAEQKAASRTKDTGLTFQDMVSRLTGFWARQGAVVALPYDMEVGAGTMCPETFFRVLGPEPWKVAYIQPSRRPADGRYGENPNRLIKHTQLQVILKPPPDNVQDIYLRSLRDIGIDFRSHDIRFEEDNWEAPTLGAWGIGWQVMLDGLEITQFTYFQQSGGVDLDPISVELTYGLERIAAFLQNVNNVYEVKWNNSVKYGDLRHREEFELSLYDFESASPESIRELFELYEAEATRLLKDYFTDGLAHRPVRFPLLKVYEFCLKCSHLFNILDARGAISVTERVALIARIRKIATEVAQVYLEQSSAAAEVKSA